MEIIPWQEDRLAEVLSLWNRELGNEFPMRTDLLKQNSMDDTNVLREGSKIALNEEGEVIGFIVSKIYRDDLDVPMNTDVGWIQVLLVHSDYRNRGYGSTLLQLAEVALKQHNVTKIKIGSDLFHYFPGVPKEFDSVANWLQNRNYQFTGNEYDLYRHFQQDEFVPLPEKEGVTFSLLQKEEQEKFLSFLHRCFPGRWEYEAKVYFEKGGTGREFVVLKKDEDIIGFCRINDHLSPFIAQNVYWAPLFDQPLGGIGPLGIDSQARKNGYGLAIVEAGISMLRDRSMEHIVIDWTGLVDFYGKLKFNVWKTYAKYEKDLGDVMEGAR